METFIYIISPLLLLLSLTNLALNSRTKYWELFTLIPTSFFIYASIFLTIISIFIHPLFIIMNVLSLMNFIPYFDFTFFKKKKKTANLNTIKFVGWNTLYFHPKNPQLIADEILGKKPDIIFVQELFKISDKLKDTSFVDNMKNFEDPIGYLKKDDIKRYFPDFKYIETSFDRGIISKYPVKVLKEHAINTKFGYFIASVLVNEKEIILVNVHMSFIPNFTFGFDEKKEAFRNLYEDLDLYKDKNIIINGDFNASKSSNFIRNLFNKFNEAISENVFGLHTSWSVKFPFWRLDFLFFKKSDNFDIVSAKLFENGELSDHKGIEAQIRI